MTLPSIIDCPKVSDVEAPAVAQMLVVVLLHGYLAARGRMSSASARAYKCEREHDGRRGGEGVVPLIRGLVHDSCYDTGHQ